MSSFPGEKPRAEGSAALRLRDPSRRHDARGQDPGGGSVRRSAYPGEICVSEAWIVRLKVSAGYRPPPFVSGVTGVTAVGTASERVSVQPLESDWLT